MSILFYMEVKLPFKPQVEVIQLPENYREHMIAKGIVEPYLDDIFIYKVGTWAGQLVSFTRGYETS